MDGLQYATSSFVIHITSNDRSFGYAINYSDTIQTENLVIDTSAALYTNKFIR